MILNKTKTKLTYSSALKKLSKALNTLDRKSEKILISSALNRIIAQDIYSSIDNPPKDNSAVDGYAFIYNKNTINNKKYIIVGESLAGNSYKKAIKNIECIKITTGAHIPYNANTVIMDENIVYEGISKTILIKGPIKKGANIRKKGEDVKSKQKILLKGHRLRAQDIGLLTSIGLKQVKVVKKINVCLVSSGDEIVEPGKKKSLEEIYDVNRYMLSQMLNSNNINITDLGIVNDSLDNIKSILTNASKRSDLILFTGGMSSGKKDFVIQAIKEVGEVNFWKIAIKPGRPIGFGSINKTLFLGLPGNPVAVFVTFLLFAIPLIKHLLNEKKINIKKYQVLSNFNLSKKTGRREYIRGKLINDKKTVKVNKFKHQGAGVLSSLVWSDGLIELEENISNVKKNDLVNFIPFESIII